MSKGQRLRDQAARDRIRAQQAAAKRAEIRRRWLIIGGAIVAVAGVVIGLVVSLHPASKNNTASSKQVIPPSATGTPTVQPAALQVANTSGITGVVAYDTTGWPSTSHNGPANSALPHNHVTTPVTYSVTPPVGGDHSGIWMNCGIYSKPVPNEHAVHNLEHGAVWITYQPSVPSAQVAALRAFVERQSLLPSGSGARSRFMDLTPYPGLSSPIVISSWGFQLRVTSPTDPRLQQFVNKFRVSKQFTPEYGAPCTGGIGTPLQT
jgi:hypothetical protein